MKILVILSGGMDSATMLYDFKERGNEVEAMSFDYGQRHRVELKAASRISVLAQVPHYVVNLSTIRPLLKGSSQTDGSVEVPEGHYAEETMKKTVVPNRNMIMLSLAAAYAISQKMDAIAYGAHAGDHAIYPDCRPEFIHHMRQVFKTCDWHQLQLLTPFMNLTKADILKIGFALKSPVPYDLTWTCYKGNGYISCGKCGACQERLEAFKAIGKIDPLTYA